MRKRRYTIVTHQYLGAGSYVIQFKRISCTPQDLPKRMRDVRDGEPHFSIAGWPDVRYPEGEPYFN